MRRLLRYLGSTLLFVGLTALTQVGGVAYLVGLAVGWFPSVRHSAPSLRRTAVVIAAVSSYLVMTLFFVPPLNTGV